jgi:hypothetical protein
MRDAFLDHPWFGYTEEFCRLYDGPAFDPKFKPMALEEFEPMVHRVMTNVKNSIYVPKPAPAVAPFLLAHDESTA